MGDVKVLEAAGSGDDTQPPVWSRYADPHTGSPIARAQPARCRPSPAYGSELALRPAPSTVELAELQFDQSVACVPKLEHRSSRGWLDRSVHQGELGVRSGVGTGSQGIPAAAKAGTTINNSSRLTLTQGLAVGS